MNDKQISIIKQQLTVKNDRPVTTSLTIAKTFDKEHKNVMRDVEAIDCSREFNRLNFEPIYYSDSLGREQPAYEITKDGFMFLAMSYTGRKAALLKECWIAAFNVMAEEIRSGMAITRNETAKQMLALVTEASEKGYPATFLPLLVQCRMGGLSCENTGKVLGVSHQTVSTWHRKVAEAGLELPKGTTVNSTIVFLRKKQEGRQLSLPFAGVA